MAFMELMAVSYHFQSRFNLKQRFIRYVIDTGDSVNYKRLKSLASCFTDEFLQSIPFGMNAAESASTGL